MRMASRLVVAVTLVLGAGVAYTVPAATAAAPAWSIVPSVSPVGSPSGFLSSVACPSATNCFAAGSFSGIHSPVPLVEHWDGASWSLMPVPPPVPGPGAYGSSTLSDIACPSATICFAVGTSSVESKSSTLIEGWNGATWSVVPSPTTADLQQLVSIACTGPTHCFAASASTAMLEWSGATWTAVAASSAPEFSGFEAISCGSTTCFAVGSAYVNGQNTALVERWNGSAWSIVSIPLPAGAANVPIQTVSCVSDTSCLLLGNFDGGTKGGILVEQWNGTTWSIVASPKFAAGSRPQLLDLACSSSTECFAIGSFSRGSNQPYLTLIEHWNGVSWATVSSPNSDPASDFLYGVGCSSSADCFAVGFSGGGFGVNTTAAIEHWNGTSWSISAAVQARPTNSTLSAVSCPSVSTCFGIGSYTSASGAVVTLIERGSASGWTVVASPSPAGARQTALSGVSCPSVTVCFAVGSWTGNGSPKTLIERWNGKSWSVAPSPSDPQYISTLTSVACTSVSNCFAVGQRQGPLIGTFIERWNGSKWSIVPSPSRAPSPNFEIEGVNNLRSVTCAGPTTCFAVGGDTGSNVDFNETLILRWNGAKWTIVKSPNGAKYSYLSSVSCASAKSCYAVGYSVAKGGLSVPEHTLVLHWNGTAWARVTVPEPALATRNVLDAVSCPSATTCVAVGGAAGSSSRNQTYAVRMSGTKWSIMSSPNPAGATDAVLYGVSCRTASTCFAVGDFNEFSSPQTLVEGYA